MVHGLELARVLKDRPREFTYEFVWFDGEEAVVDWYAKLADGNSDNTYGSRYYVQAAQKANALAAIKAMILVDIIGDRDLQIYQEGNSLTGAPKVVELVWRVAGEIGYRTQFPAHPRHTITDDHIPLQQAGIPAIDLIDLDYPYWHTPEDTFDKVSAESLKTVAEVGMAVVRRGGK